MKKIIFWLTIIFPLSALAAGLQVDLPTVGGIKPTESFGPGHWIQYIFVFALSIVGLAVIAAFVWAGIEYMTAGDNSSKVSSARSRMWSAVQGLIILLGSYIVLNTINPDLVNIREPKIELYIESHWREYYEPDRKQPIGGSCTGDGGCISNKCDTSAGRCVESSAPLLGNPQPQSSQTLPANPTTSPTPSTQPKGLTPPQE